MPTNTERSRQARILDAAENAFAEFGFNGASLRRIVQDAGVNLATVYYYFDSKEGLMQAVLSRRLGPLRQEHLELLRRYEQSARGRPLAVESLLEAMLLPPLRLAAAPPAKRQAITRLVGRIATEPNPRTQELLRDKHADVRGAFLEAAQASLPHVPLPVLRWRLEFVWGALAFILCNPRRIEKESHGACNPVAVDTVLAEMIRFFSPGFRAPAAKPARSAAPALAAPGTARPRGENPKSKQRIAL
jgi:AcrR family transcriptional regulator